MTAAWSIGSRLVSSATMPDGRVLVAAPSGWWCVVPAAPLGVLFDEKMMGYAQPRSMDAAKAAAEAAWVEHPVDATGAPVRSEP